MSNIINICSARKEFLNRAARIIQNEDCIECNYSAACRGGCSVRAYSVMGKLFLIKLTTALRI